MLHAYSGADDVHDWPLAASIVAAVLLLENTWRAYLDWPSVLYTTCTLQQQQLQQVMCWQQLRSHADLHETK
jgi:hypothetical protein